LNCVTASAGAVTFPLISIPGSPPPELEDDELELELLDDALLLLDELEELVLDELELDELDELELEELELDELEVLLEELEPPPITPLAELDDELELDELDELELEDELLAAAPPLELDEELDELDELDEELEPESLGLSRCFESELLQPNSNTLIEKAKTSL
jgi:hypothetical protein